MSNFEIVVKKQSESSLKKNIIITPPDSGQSGIYAKIDGDLVPEFISRTMLENLIVSLKQIGSNATLNKLMNPKTPEDKFAYITEKQFESFKEFREEYRKFKNQIDDVCYYMDETTDDLSELLNIIENNQKETSD